MRNPSDILNVPITYDIIVSDFGRDACIEYLRLTSEIERNLIKTVLVGQNLPFIDEYRRMMFTVVADMAYYKAAEISACAMNCGHLTEEILIGVGSNSTPQAFQPRLEYVVDQVVGSAIARGYTHIRIIIPCNTLSGLMIEVGAKICRRRSIALEPPITEHGHARSCAGMRIGVRTVPDAVLRRVQQSSANRLVDVLVLGTAMARAMYQRIEALYAGVAILDVSAEEQTIIDQAIIASISRDEAAIATSRRLLLETLIKPRKPLERELVIIEACTDLRMDLGVSFARGVR